VWAATSHDPLLHDSAAALFGTMLHSVRHRFLIDPDRTTPRRELVLQLVGTETRALEVRMAAEGRLGVVPLRSAIGRRKWDDRIRRLRLWADNVERWPERYQQIRTASPNAFLKTFEDTYNAFAEGPEPRWQAATLRLRGRPDEARSIGGVLSITDLKTGTPFAQSGEFATEIVTQLHLYALMAENLSPGTPVRLFVQHSRKDPVPWDEATRVDIRRRHTSLLERFPVGAALNAPTAASPGPHCAGCRFRPACAAYLTQAPRWWTNDPGNPRPLPFDVWGTVSKMATDELVQLEIRDPLGRMVQVEGLRRDRDWSSVSPGTTVYLFGLEPTEDTTRHGARIHPRNFHEATPGAPWKDALSVQVFVER